MWAPLKSSASPLSIGVRVAATGDDGERRSTASSALSAMSSGSAMLNNNRSNNTKRMKLNNHSNHSFNISTPNRPQKSEGASMLLGMAAFLENQSTPSSGTGGGAKGLSSSSSSSEMNKNVTPKINIHTKSGAKMLADAEFLVSTLITTFNIVSQFVGASSACDEKEILSFLLTCFDVCVFFWFVVFFCSFFCSGVVGWSRYDVLYYE